MKTTLYITRTGDMIEYGKPAEVTLSEYPEISRTWVRRVVVDLPEGFEVAEAQGGSKRIYKGSECYSLISDTAGNPVIVDHTQPRPQYIPLPILREGWDA